jgi:hypothetical protein
LETGAGEGARVAQFEVRPCRRGDLPQVIDLLISGGGRVLPGVTRDAAAAYAERIYFNSPWANPETPSLVGIGAAGDIEGFVGVIGRRMRYLGEPIEVAVPGNFKVRPGPDGKVNAFAALAMLKRVFGGPHDLTLTDTANEASRRLWDAAGAITLGTESLDWYRPIKPATTVLKIMEIARGSALPMAGPAQLATRAADLVGQPMLSRLSRRRDQPYTIAPLDDAALLTLWGAKDRRFDLQGDLDESSVRWLRRELADKAEGRRLREGLVLDEQGARAGGFIYILSKDGVARVLLMLALPNRSELVLQAVTSDAGKLGATVVTGAVETCHLPAYKAQYCLMTANQWAMAHSRRPELIAAIREGRLRLTGLDGERWTRFGDLFLI